MGNGNGKNGCSTNSSRECCYEFPDIDIWFDKEGRIAIKPKTNAGEGIISFLLATCTSEKYVQALYDGKKGDDLPSPPLWALEYNYSDGAHFFGGQKKYGDMSKVTYNPAIIIINMLFENSFIEASACGALNIEANLAEQIRHHKKIEIEPPSEEEIKRINYLVSVAWKDRVSLSEAKRGAYFDSGQNLV